jgi:integrase
MSDWKQLLAAFGEASPPLKNRPQTMAAARSWTRFLGETISEPDEASLWAWTLHSAIHCTLENTVRQLYVIEPFVAFLANRGACPGNAARNVRERPDLLVQLLQACPTVRFRIPVPPYWSGSLTDFAATLRGLALCYQVQLVRAVCEFVARLPSGPVQPAAWDSVVFSWLDELLATHALESVRGRYMPGLTRFLEFLVSRGRCAEHPLRRWRAQQAGWVDALQRRQQGRSPQPRPPRFRSFLASEMEAFLQFRTNLGRKRLSTTALRALDRHLCVREVSQLAHIDAPFLLEACRGWRRPLTRRVGFGALRQFFRYLERRGLLVPERNPARHLPRVPRPSRPPYIFSVQEVVLLLEQLLEDPIRHPFDASMHFALFHLLYACGLRISEPVRLKIDDLDWAEQTLFLRTTKFGKERRVPFGARVAQHLQRYHRLRCERLGEPQGTALFFVRAAGQPSNPTTLRMAFQEACRRAGVGDPTRPRPRPHDLRHSMAVHRLYKWYQEGAEPQKRLIFLSIFMGHVAPSSTQYYLNLSHDLLRLAGLPLERGLGGWLQETLPGDER